MKVIIDGFIADWFQKYNEHPIGSWQGEVAKAETEKHVFEVEEIPESNSMILRFPSDERWWVKTKHIKPYNGLSGLEEF